MTQDSAARKILVVDDSVSIVFSIGKILELNGYAVDSAYNVATLCARSVSRCLT
jgi:DNA-binding NtrC family response regulator